MANAGQPQVAESIYENGKELWKSVGIFIRGVMTQAITKTEGPFAAGKAPGEADCEDSICPQ